METQSEALKVGQTLVELCKKGENLRAVDQLYSDRIESHEAVSMPGMPEGVNGIEAIRKKNREWDETMNVHSMEVDGPFPCGDRFAVYFKIDATDKKTQKRMKMNEVGLYTVHNGKIIKEEFFYAM
ncbi:nuclear transport factor 2 family protein [Bdellovibrio sp.]|uniref:nuclear transport factor 2 family protein n=1 Tax=Bdellovibrio sp. TaxID=28201 RepID=UPI0032217BE7